MKADLNTISKSLRRKIIETSFQSKIPHLGSCLSCIDLLIYLYWCELNINPVDSKNKSRDRKRFERENMAIIEK